MLFFPGKSDDWIKYMIFPRKSDDLIKYMIFSGKNMIGSNILHFLVCFECGFPVLDEVRRVATSLSRRVLLKRGFGTAGCGLKERRRRVSLNNFAIFLLLGGCALKPQN